MFRALILSTTLLVTALFQTTHAGHHDPVLTIRLGETVQLLKASQLLAHKEVQQITVPKDVAYGRSMTYTAVPLLSLLPSGNDLDFDTLEVRATDGFVSQLPTALIKRANSGGAVAWVAIEPPDKAWPKISNKEISAGPFFIVWLSPEKSDIGPEQWPYAVAEFRGVRSPIQRWPQLAVRSTDNTQAAASAGMAVYLKHCFACHKIAGAGEATMGPDMAHPMSPTTYMTEFGLRALIRNPSAVRTWPKQEMPGFSSEVLPEDDLDNVIAYLRYMSGKSERATQKK